MLHANATNLPPTLENATMGNHGGRGLHVQKVVARPPLSKSSDSNRVGVVHFVFRIQLGELTHGTATH